MEDGILDENQNLIPHSPTSQESPPAQDDDDVQSLGDGLPQMSEGEAEEREDERKAGEADNSYERDRPRPPLASAQDSSGSPMDVVNGTDTSSESGETSSESGEDDDEEGEDDDEDGDEMMEDEREEEPPSGQDAPMPTRARRPMKKEWEDGEKEQLAGDGQLALQLAKAQMEGRELEETARKEMEAEMGGFDDVDDEMIRQEKLA